MNVDRNELEALDRESLVTRARNLGVERAEVLTRLEIIDEILSSSIPDEQERRVARGLLGRARDLVARVVEKGLNLPDAALRLLVVSLVFAAIGLPCMLVWAVFGAGLRPWLRDRAVARVVNRAMATLAALTVLLFWI